MTSLQRNWVLRYGRFQIVFRDFIPKHREENCCISRVDCDWWSGVLKKPLQLARSLNIYFNSTLNLFNLILLPRLLLSSSIASTSSIALTECQRQIHPTSAPPSLPEQLKANASRFSSTKQMIISIRSGWSSPGAWFSSCRPALPCSAPALSDPLILRTSCSRTSSTLAVAPLATGR